MCRLVFVKDLEFISSTDGTSVPTPPAGQTELPTCPVCLERLDEHISGIVTTVYTSHMSGAPATIVGIHAGVMGF